jgi:hypothetical protein
MITLYRFIDPSKGTILQTGFKLTLRKHGDIFAQNTTNMKITVLWNVMPYILVDRYRRHISEDGILRSHWSARFTSHVIGFICWDTLYWIGPSSLLTSETAYVERVPKNRWQYMPVWSMVKCTPPFVIIQEIFINAYNHQYDIQVFFV